MKHLLLPFLLLGLIWTGCDPDDEPGTTNTCTSGLAQTRMLETTARDVIVASYADLTEATEALRNAKEAFAAAPTVATLETLRTAFEATYLTWQYAAPYQFGPADEQFLRSSFNNFPLDAAALEAKVAAADYTFDQPDTYDKGLPALDYLLYHEREGAGTLNYLQSTPNATAFMSALVDDLDRRAAAVLNGWQNGYQTEFVANTGTAAGTSLSELINRLNEHYESIKRDKLGLPAGVMTIGIANPDRVEAPYSGISLELLDAALRASQQLYQGTNGTGLGNYLSQMPNAEAADLHKQILERYETAISAADGLSGELSQLVQEEQASVTNVYAEVTRQLVNIKTDLPALTCVSITYIDNPSDSD